jgi:hypothetical protein
MKASELIEKLQMNVYAHGDFDVACPGDHQMLYKVTGIDVTYVEDFTEYQMEEKHKDDVDDYIADGGTPTKVFVVFG